MEAKQPFTRLDDWLSGQQAQIQDLPASLAACSSEMADSLQQRAQQASAGVHGACSVMQSWVDEEALWFVDEQCLQIPLNIVPLEDGQGASLTYAACGTDSSEPDAEEDPHRLEVKPPGAHVERVA